MTTQETAPNLIVLREISDSLKLIAQALSPDKLGIQPYSTVIYANPDGGSGWYTLGDADGAGVREKQHVKGTVKGYLADLSFITKTTNNGESEKMRLSLNCGASGYVIIEAGADANFAKSLLYQLLAVNPADLELLKKPVTIGSYVSRTKKGFSLFSLLTLANGEKPYKPWDDNDDLEQLKKDALVIVKTAAGLDTAGFDPA